MSASLTSCHAEGGSGGETATPTLSALAVVADAPVFAAAVADATNEVRRQHGLQPLTLSPCAAERAESRAADLLAARGLVHAPLQPVIESCPPATTAAENLGRGQVTAQRMVEAWLGSPGHRANLLDPELTEVGVGCVPLGEGDVVCSQVFLASKPLASPEGEPTW